MKDKVYYYDDLLNDDFLPKNQKTLKIDGNYKYERKNIFRKMLEFIVHRIIMVPVAFFYVKIKYGQKTVGKKALKKSDGGYFLYGNHVLIDGDSFIPNLLSLPKKTYVVVHPDNLSKKGLKTFLELNGAFPIPLTYEASKNFLRAAENRINKKSVIAIYPEAHVWHYYTGVRPFKSTAFRYPVKFNCPCFCFTNVLLKRKLSKIPKIVTYVDGPFFPDKNLSEKDGCEKLRDAVLKTMQERAKLSDYDYVKYLKRDENYDQSFICGQR